MYNVKNGIRIRNYFLLLLFFTLSLIINPHNFNSSLETEFDSSDSLNQPFEITEEAFSDTIWSQPFQITTPDFTRDDYVITQDHDGITHCVFLKSLNVYGTSLMYTRTTLNSTRNWTLATQIIQFQENVASLNLDVDNNNSLHLTFISHRESLSQINYLTKITEDEWSNRSIIKRSGNLTYSCLVTTLSKNSTLHISWIAREIGTAGVNRNSNICLTNINLTENTIDQTKRLFNSYNPKKVSLLLLNSSKIGITFTKWDDLIQGDDFYSSISADLANSWSTPVFIETYPTPIDKLYTIASNITNGFHIIWNVYDSPKRILHLELFENYTIRTSMTIVNNLFYDAYFAGMVEDSLTGDIYLFFEEIVIGKSNLYYKKRNGSTLTWSIQTTITSNDNSMFPLFEAQSDFNSTQSFGNLFYIEYESLVVSTFTKTENFINHTVIIETTPDNGAGQFVVDSNERLHHLWLKNGILNTEIFYQVKHSNGSLENFGSILDEEFYGSTSPTIIIDSTDNLHCFFIANDVNTSQTGLFYLTKNNNQNNWSTPKLVKSPFGYAQTNNYVAKIDDLDNIHVIWTEQTAIYQNIVFYATKLKSESTFTSSTIIANTGQISVLNPDLVIDSFGNIHFMYIEYDRSYPVYYIKYRSKPMSQDWSAEFILEGTTSEVLYRPLLSIDTNDNLKAIYLKRYFNGENIVADSILWEKDFSEDWNMNGTIFGNEMIIQHNLVDTINDTLVYTQYIINTQSDTFTNDYYDFVTASFMTSNEAWSEREIIFQNPNYQYEPFGYYDQYSNNVYITIYERRTGENQIHLVNRQSDTDNDFLGDFDETLFRTNNLLQDSDSDSIMDGLELLNYGTHPAINDTDWDNLTDGIEVLTYESDPNLLDTDQDSIFDGVEVLLYNTNPVLMDSDLDGLNDNIEIFTYGTNPNNSDTDSDLMPDLWEINNLLNPIVNDSKLDADNDNLNNLDEYLSNTNPNVNDSDLDGLLDGDEVNIWNTNPLSIDSDNDTISDFDEVMNYNTDPNKEDSDEDNFTDREEINAGTDPLNSRDNPFRRKVRRILLSVIVPLFVILAFYAFFEIKYRLKINQIADIEKAELQIEEELLSSILKKESESKSEKK